MDRTRDQNYGVILSSDRAAMDDHQQYALAVKAIRYNILAHLSMPVHPKEIQVVLDKMAKPVLSETDMFPMHKTLLFETKELY